MQETSVINNLQVGCCRLKYQEGRTVMSGLMLGNNLLHIFSAMHPGITGD